MVYHSLEARQLVQKDPKVIAGAAAKTPGPTAPQSQDHQSLIRNLTNSLKDQADQNLLTYNPHL